MGFEGQTHQAGGQAPLKAKPFHWPEANRFISIIVLIRSFSSNLFFQIESNVTRMGHYVPEGDLNS